jgi:hypothetical protein
MKKFANSLRLAVWVLSILTVLSAANCARPATDLPAGSATATDLPAGSATATDLPAGSATATDLPAGSATGSLTYDGATADLKFAAAFVDQEDEGKPIVLLISDQKLPVEKWESEFDMMMDHSKWSGVVFFLDKDGNVFRADVHMNGRQSSVAGIFELKLDNPSSKDFTGTAKATADEKETKLDTAFHATLK